MELGYIYAAATIVAGVILAGIVYGIIHWLKKRAEKTSSPLDDIILMSVGTPLVVAIIFLSVYFALTSFDVVPESMNWIILVINAVFIVIGAWIVSVFASKFIHTYGTRIAERTDTGIDPRIIPALVTVVRYVIWFIAFLWILAELEIDITPFLAGAGIGALAIALAAKEILSNFLGGLIIAVDKPFRIDDRVKIDTFSGDVMSIGPRSTRIKTSDNQIVTVPNSTATSSVVVNYTMPDSNMKVKIPFSVAYGSDMEKVNEILLDIVREAAEKTSWVLTDPAPSVYFLELGESSLNGQLLLWTNNYNHEPDVKDYVIRRIVRRFHEENIEIPFRQVDLWMRKPGAG